MPAQSCIKILNVNYNDLARYATTRILRQAGFDVKEARSGSEALKMVALEQPQLVLLDVNLPDKDGGEVCRRIKADPSTAGISVLQISDRPIRWPDRAKELEQGADGYIAEPVEPAELIGTVNAFIRAQEAERKVKATALQWQATFDAINDGIALLDLEGKLLRCNRSFASIARQPISQLIGRDWSTLWRDTVCFLDDAPFARMVKSHKRETIEIPLWEGWFQVTIDPALSQEGALISAVCTLSDITQRRQAEDTLRATNERLRSILASITDSYFSLDLRWRFLEVNAVAERTIFQRGAGELLGKVFWEEYPQTVDTEFYRQCHVARAEVRPVNFEYKSAIIDRWFETHAYPRRGRIEIYLRDITDRKRAEEERAELLVREQEARREAETANRLKDEFLATVSHELRTPLNAVLGWTSLLRSGKLDPHGSERALETIDRNAREQAKLVDDLLDAARTVAGKLRLELRRVQLSPLIQAAIESLRPAAAAKNIEIVTRIEPIGGHVSGDPHRLQQIISNLLSNSIKFTPSGGRIEVGFRPVDSQAEITVRDTGIGIKADFIRYAFDSFRQSNSTVTRAYSGLGLGLAITRKLVEMHGGTVRAESPGEGKGSTFTVLLPLAVNTAGVLKRELESANLGPTTLRGMRVLIVDDESQTREQLTEALKTFGAEVVTAESAVAARQILTTFRCDILVSDIEMPGEDGYALVSALRALRPEQGGEIPAIALTGYARAQDRRQTRVTGFQAHISKPVQPTALALLITRIAGQRAVNQSPHTKKARDKQKSRSTG